MAARLCETHLKRHVVIFLLFVCFVQICAQFRHPRARTQTRPGVDYITAQVCFAPWCHRWLAASTAPLDKRSTIRNMYRFSNHLPADDSDSSTPHQCTFGAANGSFGQDGCWLYDCRTRPHPHPTSGYYIMVSAVAIKVLQLVSNGHFWILNDWIIESFQWENNSKHEAHVTTFYFPNPFCPFFFLVLVSIVESFHPQITCFTHDLKWSV